MFRPLSTIRLLCLLLLALLCSVPSLQAQTTIRVPADRSTIQAAIDEASAGDTVLVAPGAYHESIDFKGKAITVTGSGKQADAQILGSGQKPSVSFTSGEGRNSILSNVTVEGGGAPGTAEQAGIYIHDASPTLRGNQIFGGVCHGIHVVNGAPLIDSNLVVATVGSNANVGCTVANGTGIFMDGQTSLFTATIQNNDIEANFTAISVPGAESGGAGIFVRNAASVVIQKNIITGNGAGGTGGAVLIQEAPAVLFGNLIYNNFAYANGGGVVVNNSSGLGYEVEILNNTIAGNRAVISNTAIQTGIAGSDVLILSTVPLTLANNIIWSNEAQPAVTCNSPKAKLLVNFQANDIHNASGPAVTDAQAGTCGFVAGQYGNITDDPVFADVGFFQFHLLPQSPAIDTGSNDALRSTLTRWPADSSTDLDGHPRIVNATMKPAAIIDMGAYEFQDPTLPSSFTLTSSLNPSALGQTVTFSAAVTLQSGPATGSITFNDGSTTLGTVALSGGTAQFATAALTAGTHQITASFNPNGTQGPSTTSLTQVVNGRPTTTSLTVSPTSAQAFSPILLTAQVTSSSGAPTGVVTFKSGGQTLGTAPLQSDGTAQITLRTLGAGTYSLTATYSGDTSFQPSLSSPASLVLTPVASSVTLSATPNPASPGQNVSFRATVPFTPGNPAPSGTATFSIAGRTLGAVPLDANGMATFNTTALPAGSTVVNVTYSGDLDYAPSSASVQVLVNLVATAVTLSSTPNPSFLGQTVTLTASLTAGGSAVNGLLTFYDGPTALATIPASANGATVTTSTLSTGQHTLTAAFQGDASNAGSISAPVTQTVQAAGFSIKLSPASITFPSGKGGSTLVQLTSLGNYTGPLALTSGSLPSHSSGSFTSPSVMLTGGAQGSTTFNISTVDLTAALHPAAATAPPRAIALALLCLPALLFRRRRAANLLLTVLLGVVLAGLTGCTEIREPLATVKPGLYNISITATDAHNVSQTAFLQIDITP